MEVVIGASRGLGASVRPTVISVLGVCGVRIAWVLAVLPYTNCVETVYVAYPISWAVTLAAQCVLLILVRKKLQKKELAL